MLHDNSRYIKGFIDPPKTLQFLSRMLAEALWIMLQALGQHRLKTSRITGATCCRDGPAGIPIIHRLCLLIVISFLVFSERNPPEALTKLPKSPQRLVRRSEERRATDSSALTVTFRRSLAQPSGERQSFCLTYR